MFCKPVVESGNVNVRSFTAIVGSGILGQIYVMQTPYVVTLQRRSGGKREKKENGYFEGWNNGLEMLINYVAD